MILWEAYWQAIIEDPKHACAAAVIVVTSSGKDMNWLRFCNTFGITITTAYTEV